MAYIGKTPITGNFVKLDAISVVDGQAGYTMNNGGSAFTDYENVNQFLVSLNGILQAPTTSFSVSGSTLTFASNLATGDVIDFVMVLGNTLDIGTPSDSTVSLAKLTATGTKDATTFLRGDNTFAEAGGGKLLQIIHGTDGTSRETTSTSFASLTLNASITPSATSSKVFVMVNLNASTAFVTKASFFTVYRDSSNLGASDGFIELRDEVADDTRMGASFSTLDSPSSTSALSYTVYGKCDSSGKARINDDSRGRSTITLMEIGA